MPPVSRDLDDELSRGDERPKGSDFPPEDRRILEAHFEGQVPGDLDWDEVLQIVRDAKRAKVKGIVDNDVDLIDLE